MKQDEQHKKTLEVFLKEDRQWPRHPRIQHAQMQLKNTNTWETEKYQFWQEVLDANGRIVNDNRGWK